MFKTQYGMKPRPHFAIKGGAALAVTPSAMTMNQNR